MPLLQRELPDGNAGGGVDVGGFCITHMPAGLGKQVIDDFPGGGFVGHAVYICCDAKNLWLQRG
jgi:hypothetical protein